MSLVPAAIVFNARILLILALCRWSKPINPVPRLTPRSSVSSLRRNQSSYSTSATFL